MLGPSPRGLSLLLRNRQRSVRSAEFSQDDKPDKSTCSEIDAGFPQEKKRNNLDGKRLGCLLY